MNFYGRSDSIALYEAAAGVFPVQPRTRTTARTANVDAAAAAAAAEKIIAIFGWAISVSFVTGRGRRPVSIEVVVAAVADAVDAITATVPRRYPGDGADVAKLRRGHNVPPRSRFPVFLLCNRRITCVGPSLGQTNERTDERT